MRVSRPALIAAVSSAILLIILVVGFFVLAGGKPAALKGGAAKPTPKAAAPRLYSPFTGEPIARLGPELIFKIDNVEQARPPTGLTKADLIYILPVEGGLSRIFAVFSSHFPPVVGPVRSSRAEDLELLSQFGRPAFAYSGAQPELLPVVEHARIVDLYAGIVGGYYRDLNRIAPYNLYARTKVLLSQAKGASKARNIGFRFGPAPPGGRPTSSYSLSYPAAAFTFRWSRSQHRWLSWMDGRPADATEGGQLGAPTVVIQSVVVGASHFRELGIKPPYANTVGRGTAIVLRGGRAYLVHWSRPRDDGGTTFTLPDGQPMPFARGQVWVVYKYGPGSTGQEG
jgi:Protein of unknown function (DUF3048) N-terminal domain/Protein of unknown function (DUF3048) C-terminal domain